MVGHITSVLEDLSSTPNTVWLQSMVHVVLLSLEYFWIQKVLYLWRIIQLSDHNTRLSIAEFSSVSQSKWWLLILNSIMLTNVFMVSLGFIDKTNFS